MARRKRCVYCGELIDHDDLIFDREGKAFHQDCEFDCMENASTIVGFGPEGFDEDFDVERFNSHFTRSEKTDDVSYPVPVKQERWVRTDAWRGYTAWDFLPGYVEFADGWVTGYPDESTRRKMDLADLYEDFRSGKIVPPCQIYWLFGNTSNVFSTATSIVVAEKDTPIINEWLESRGLSQEDLQEKLA